MNSRQDIGHELLSLDEVDNFQLAVVGKHWSKPVRLWWAEDETCGSRGDLRPLTNYAE